MIVFLKFCNQILFKNLSAEAAQLPITGKRTDMKVRVLEHQGVSPRTGKQVKGNLSTLVRDHMLNCRHVVESQTTTY